MPSLMPKMPGAKEVYGISIVKNDNSITIPPKALIRYQLSHQDIVLLTSTHKGEGGVSVLNKEKAYKNVFRKIIDEIDQFDTPVWFGDRAYALTKIYRNKIILKDNLKQTFKLKVGDKLLVIKSAAIAMSYTPIEIWKKKLEMKGFFKAIKNMDKLEEF